MQPISAMPFNSPYPQTPDVVLEEQFPMDSLLEAPMVPIENGPDPRFCDNLIPYINPQELERIAQALTLSITNDEKDRQKWLRILTQGIEQLGIGIDRAPSTNTGKDSDLYATTFLTECLKITCKIFSTIFPGYNFSDTQINGDHSEELFERAKRNKDFFNFYTN